MFDFFKKSLANRLLLSFIGIGFLPFVIFLVYTLVLSEQQIVKKLIADQHHEAQVISKLIDTHLNSLTKEVSFLAKLELMDDVLADDADKRISRLLKQKRDDYALNLNFFLVKSSSEIIASSDIDILTKRFLHVEKLNAKNGNFFIYKNLYIYTEVFASFDNKKSLGYLVLEYDLDNLNIFLENAKDSKAYISSSGKKISIGDNPNLQFLIKGNKNSINIGKYLIVYKKMDNILKDWYIFYAVEKHKALEFFYNFILFMLYLSPFILILVLFISWKSSKYIVKPIEDLTLVTDEIIHTKDYTRYLDMVCEDEIGHLANAFNTLLNTTDKSIDASEAKSSFISNMSHELKTPLNAIIGFSQYLITYEKLTDEQLDIVSKIESSSQYLLEMIHGILDIAKIEAGKMDIKFQDINLINILQESVDMLEPLADDKGLKLFLHVENFKKQNLQSDIKLLKQIIINLISNAIKFTEEGTVKIELTNQEDTVIIKVIDTGIGIKQEQMSKLFKDFSRIESHLQTKHKGTGLGLSLSKKLAEVLNGKVWLESDGKNTGTTAILSLKRFKK